MCLRLLWSFCSVKISLETAALVVYWFGVLIAFERSIVRLLTKPISGMQSCVPWFLLEAVNASDNGAGGDECLVGCTHIHLDDYAILCLVTSLLAPLSESLSTLSRGRTLISYLHMSFHVLRYMLIHFSQIAYMRPLIQDCASGQHSLAAWVSRYSSRLQVHRLLQLW